MELKQRRYSRTYRPHNSINRTFMELKPPVDETYIHNYMQY